MPVGLGCCIRNLSLSSANVCYEGQEEDACSRHFQSDSWAYMATCFVCLYIDRPLEVAVGFRRRCFLDCWRCKADLAKEEEKHGSVATFLTDDDRRSFMSFSRKARISGSTRSNSLR